MTTQQPALFDWATELSDAQGHVTLSEQEAHEIGARLRRLHSENETLQAGYAAARLEIESLQARIKTMAEEHADELMVAHLDGMRGRSTEPAGEYPAPTDAEIEDLYAQETGFILDDSPAALLDFARAVLARWGQPAHSGEPVAWYVTGGSRLLDEDEAKAEARHIGGTARAIPLYTAPQADSQPAATVIKKGADRQWMSERLGHLPDGIYSLYLAPPTQAQAGAVPLTDEQIEALPLWKRFVGLWPETRREIVRTIERHHGIKGGQHGAE